MTKLHLGSGGKNIPGFINIDVRADCGADVVADITSISKVFQNVDVCYNSHLLEHFPRKSLEIFPKTYKDVLKDWYKCLKVGGKLFISVPDFDAICRVYQQNGNIKELYGLLLGGQRPERGNFDIHFHVFDEKSLREDLEEIGFKNVKRFDRWEQKWLTIDDYSAATLNPPFDKNGILMSLNLECEK